MEISIHAMLKEKSSRGLSNNDNSPPDISLISTLSKKSKKSNIVESKVKEKEIELPIKVKEKNGTANRGTR